MVSTMDEQTFIQKHLKGNTFYYIAMVGLSAFTGAFSDMFAMLPNLALKLNAPGWVAVIPTVAATSITHIPPFIVAWLLRPDIQRRKIYAAICWPMFATILALGISLLLTKNQAVLLSTLVVCVISYAILNGLSIIPCWDLFARIFPENERGKVTGNAQAVGQIVGLVAAPIAAWLISTRSPLLWPVNYGVVILISVVSGVATVLLIYKMKEFQYERTQNTRSFTSYCKDLYLIMRGDTAYRSTLWGALIGSALVPVSGLMIIYAKQYRGFTDDHVATLVGIRPYLTIGSSLFFGWLSTKIGASKVCAALAILTFLGGLTAPFMQGTWQLVPQILAGFSGLIYAYILVTILAHAPAKQTQDHLSIFFLVSALPGFLPVAQAKLMDFSPPLAIASVLVISIACALCYMFTGKKEPAAG